MHMGLATKDLCHAIVLRKPASSGSVIAEIQLAFGVVGLNALTAWCIGGTGGSVRATRRCKVCGCMPDAHARSVL